MFFGADLPCTTLCSLLFAGFLSTVVVGAAPSDVDEAANPNFDLCVMPLSQGYGLLAQAPGLGA